MTLKHVGVGVLLLLIGIALGAGGLEIGRELFEDDEKVSFQGVSGKSLDDAVHIAAVQAVAVESGRYKGDTFDIVRFEITVSNPHITAYRAIISPSG
jgi:hypothetical protein